MPAKICWAWKAYCYRAGIRLTSSTRGSHAWQQYARLFEHEVELGDVTSQNSIISHDFPPKCFPSADDCSKGWSRHTEASRYNDFQPSRWQRLSGIEIGEITRQNWYVIVLAADWNVENSLICGLGAPLLLDLFLFCECAREARIVDGRIRATGISLIGADFRPYSSSAGRLIFVDADAWVISGHRCIRITARGKNIVLGRRRVKVVVGMSSKKRWIRVPYSSVRVQLVEWVAQRKSRLCGSISARRKCQPQGELVIAHGCEGDQSPTEGIFKAAHMACPWNWKLEAFMLH